MAAVRPESRSRWPWYRSSCGSLLVVVGAGALLGLRPQHGVLEGGPAEQGALDPGGELRDAGEGDTVLEAVLVRLQGALALHQGEELLVQVEAVVDGLADDQVAHHGGGGLRDGAADTLVGDVPDGAAVEVHAEGHLVAAGGVDVVHLRLVRVPETAVVLGAVVVQDDLLVQLVDLHRVPPKNLRSEEHTSELQSRQYLVCRLLLEKKK